MRNPEQQRDFLRSRTTRIITRAALAVSLASCGSPQSTYSVDALIQSPQNFAGRLYAVGPANPDSFMDNHESVQIGGTIYESFAIENQGSVLTFLSPKDQKILKTDKKKNQPITVIGIYVSPPGNSLGSGFEISSIQNA